MNFSFEGATEITEKALRKVEQRQGYREVSPFLTNDIFPQMQNFILTHLRRATCAEDLWMVKGEQAMLDFLQTTVRRETKDPLQQIVR